MLIHVRLVEISFFILLSSFVFSASNFLNIHIRKQDLKCRVLPLFTEIIVSKTARGH